MFANESLIKTIFFLNKLGFQEYVFVGILSEELLL